MTSVWRRPGQGRRWRTLLAAHVETCRPDTVFYIGLVSLGTAVYSDPAASIGRLSLAWFVPTLGWVASLYGGDYFDRALDAVSKPHRPIPSGRMSATTALVGMILTIVVGLVLGIALNPWTALLVAVATILGISYSALLKGRGISGNLVRGVPTAMAVLFGSMAVRDFPDPTLLPVALVFCVHDAESNLLGALCDRDGDRMGGYHTFPAQRGDAATIGMLWVLFATWNVVGVMWPFAVGQRIHLTIYLCLVGVAATINATSLMVVSRAPRPIARASGLKAHEVVVLERLFLASALIASAVGLGLACVLLVPALVVTIVARARMRRVYEPKSAFSSLAVSHERS